MIKFLSLTLGAPFAWAPPLRSGLAGLVTQGVLWDTQGVLWAFKVLLLRPGLAVLASLTLVCWRRGPRLFQRRRLAALQQSAVIFLLLVARLCFWGLNVLV